MSTPFIFKPTKKYIFSIRPKRESSYDTFKEQRLTAVQKLFDNYTPVRPFNRFEKPKLADTGIDPSSALLRFMKRESTQPYIKEESEFYNNDTINKKNAASTPPKWCIGNTYKCNDPDLIPKLDPYKEYSFNHRTIEDIKKYQSNYLSTDNISIRVPKILQTEEADKYKNSPFLDMKSEFGFHKESESYWEPKNNGISTQSNRSSVEYDIINCQENKLSGAKPVGIFDKAMNYKKKGIGEFAEFLNSNNYNPNKRYVESYENNNNRFKDYKGIFSELYDSSSRNGCIYVPFKNVKAESNSNGNNNYGNMSERKDYHFNRRRFRNKL